MSTSGQTAQVPRDVDQYLICKPDGSLVSAGYGTPCPSQTRGTEHAQRVWEGEDGVTLSEHNAIGTELRGRKRWIQNNQEMFKRHDLLSTNCSARAERPPPSTLFEGRGGFEFAGRPRSTPASSSTH